MACEQADGASSDAFGASYAKVLRDAERLSVQEVERLRKALEAAKAENEWLRSRLADGGAAGHARDPDSHPCAVPQREDSDIMLEIMTTPKSSVTKVESVTAWRSVTPVVDPDHQTLQSPESLRQMSVRKQYTSRAQYHESGYAAAIAKSPYFEYGTLVAVILNAFWIAIDVDFNGKTLLESPAIYQVVEHCFVLLFTLEMIILFLAFKKKLAALRDAWFLFNAFLVILMLVETWIFTIFILIMGGSGSRALGIVSLLRIMRLLRVARVVRLCNLMPELKTIVESMLEGIRSVLIAACILFILTYTFAIFLRQLGVSTAWGKAHFHSVPISVYTLLVKGILGGRESLLSDIFFETWYCGLIFLFYLLLTAFTVMNIHSSILYGVTARVSEEDKERRGIESMVEKIKAVLCTIDTDSDGMVSKAEFKSIVGNVKAVRALHDVGVDVGALVNDADFIFTDSNMYLPFDQFKDEVLKFRASNCATNGMVAATRMLMKSHFERLEEKMSRLEMFMTKKTTPHWSLCYKDDPPTAPHSSAMSTDQLPF